MVPPAARMSSESGFRSRLTSPVRRCGSSFIRFRIVVKPRTSQKRMVSSGVRRPASQLRGSRASPHETGRDIARRRGRFPAGAGARRRSPRASARPQRAGTRAPAMAARTPARSGAPAACDDDTPATAPAMARSRASRCRATTRARKRRRKDPALRTRVAGTTQRRRVRLSKMVAWISTPATSLRGVRSRRGACLRPTLYLPGAVCIDRPTRTTRSRKALSGKNSPGQAPGNRRPSVGSRRSEDLDAPRRRHLDGSLPPSSQASSVSRNRPDRRGTRRNTPSRSSARRRARPCAGIGELLQGLAAHPLVACGVSITVSSPASTTSGPARRQRRVRLGWMVRRR